MPISDDTFTFILTSSFEPSLLVITVRITTTTVYFLPVTAPAGETGLPTTTPIAVYTLPTTAHTSDGTTQTFLRGPIHRLRTLTAPTIITTAFVVTVTVSSSTSSSTTMISI